MPVQPSSPACQKSICSPSLEKLSWSAHEPLCNNRLNSPVNSCSPCDVSGEVSHVRSSVSAVNTRQRKYPSGLGGLAFPYGALNVQHCRPQARTVSSPLPAGMLPAHPRSNFHPSGARSLCQLPFHPASANDSSSIDCIKLIQLRQLNTIPGVVVVWLQYAFF